MTDDSSWHERATCRREWVDLDWFFPQDVGMPNTAGEYKQEYGDDGLRAMLICATCPVRQQCWIENRDAEVGIFAGTTEHQRAAMAETARRHAVATGRRGKRVGIESVPGPGRWVNLLRSEFFKNQATHVRRYATHAVVSTRLQIAVYAFTRGSTVAEACEVSEVEQKLFRKHITPMERLAS